MKVSDLDGDVGDAIDEELDDESDTEDLAGGRGTIEAEETT